MEQDDEQNEGIGHEGIGHMHGRRYGAWRGDMGHHQFARAHYGQRGWLRPAIIKFLEEEPMSGMEIINKFYEISQGWWKPSPGSVYPTLSSMETEGLIKKGEDGKYSLTKKYEEENGPAGQVEDLITNMEGTISYFEDMAKSDKTKFARYKKRISDLADRLSKI